jgi:hypothetical protein
MHSPEPDFALAAELVQEIQRLSPLVAQAVRAQMASASKSA